MNREILFRAKRKGVIDGNCYRSKYKNGDWVYGLITKQYSKEFWDKLNDEMRDIYGVSGIEIDRDTVGQFTGLVDKYGKKIFTGDIIRYCDEDCYYYPEDCTEFFGEVVKECGAFGIGTQNELPLELENWCNNDKFVSLWEIYWNLNCCDGELPMIEVIGNIYDNKELLR